MTRAAPGGALREGRFRPGALLSAALPSRARPGRLRRRLLPRRHARDADRRRDASEGPIRGSSSGPIPLVPRGRRRRRRIALITAAAGAVLSLAAWAVLASPLARIRTLDVHGATPGIAAQVRAALAGQVGRQALLVDTGEVAARVRAVPDVRGVVVGVRWPSTLRVRVVERVPAVAVRAGPGVRVFDDTGVELGTLVAAPAGVPLVDVDPTATTQPAVLAVLQVRRELPPALAGQVTEMGAKSPSGVWLRLREGTRVEWGSPGNAAAKARAIAALRVTVPSGRHARVDVSAAGAPAVSW